MTWPDQEGNISFALWYYHSSSHFLRTRFRYQIRHDILFSVLPGTLLPPHVMVKHTPTLQCHLQVVLSQTSDEIRNNERLHAQTQGKIPSAEWELFGLWRSVTKHLRRKNVKPNQRICGRQRSARIINLRSLTQQAHRSAKRLGAAGPRG